MSIRCVKKRERGRRFKEKEKKKKRKEQNKQTREQTVEMIVLEMNFIKRSRKVGTNEKEQSRGNKLVSFLLVNAPFSLVKPRVLSYPRRHARIVVRHHQVGTLNSRRSVPAAEEVVAVAAASVGIVCVRRKVWVVVPVAARSAV